MRSGAWNAIGAAVMLAVAAPSAAQRNLPPPADASERALLPEVGDVLGGGRPDMRRLDALLTRLPRPTPLRGLVQLARAMLIGQSNDYAGAVPLAEEALRLLPDQPQPKLLLAELLTFTGAPQRAADLWLAASQQAPEIAREGDAYSISALIGRLTDLGDATRARIVAARMGEIGMVRLLAPDRTDAAMAQVKLLAEKGDWDGARRGLADVARPNALKTLLVDDRYRSLWPAIEAQGGADLEPAQRRWFTAVRDEWQRDRNAETAVNYARLLASVDEYATVVSLFAPMFAGQKLELDDPQIWFLAPVVARATAETGRPADARALLERLNAARDADQTMRLNASGNLANLSYLTQHWDEVVSETATWLRIAKELGPAVNSSAVLQVSSLRACALIKLGRTEDAAPLVGNILLAQRASPQPAMTLFLCQGDLNRLRTLMIARLADKDGRSWALSVVQPGGASGKLPQEVAERQMLDQLRRDPAVMTAAAKVGRILPRPFASSLPSRFDPDGVDQPIAPDSI